MRLLLLLLVAFLLCGCFSNTQTFTRNGVSLKLPAYFENKSEESYAENVDFLYTYGGIGFLGIVEKRSEFPENYGEMDLEAYGKYVIFGNELSCELKEKDGFYTFTYEVPAAPDGSLTYVAIVLEGKDAFYTIQGYCLSSFYSENASFLWKSLTSVKIA